MTENQNQYQFIYIAILLGVAMFFSACNLNQKSDLGEKQTNFPSRTIINAKMLRKEKGQVLIDLSAPIIEEYFFIDSAYTLFNQGLNIKYYSKNKPDKPPGTLKADWALHQVKADLYHAEGNVVMVNQNGDTIKTQSIYWEKAKKRITTNDTVYILRANSDSLIARNGLEAKDDLSEYTLFQHRGLFHLESGEEL